MRKGGMAIGSHTHSHTVLSQLGPERQYEELSKSRASLKENLGVGADVLAYPVGARTSFTGETQRLAQEAGYRAAFSFYGGTNFPGKTSPYDVKRIGVGDQSWSRFRVQTSVCSFTGKYWP
jgi:peptidoglycan/xylan/chitin deacetylase (PgdA/CDA1 family)